MSNNLMPNPKLNSDINYELNNKLALQCSYLINEVKRKNNKLLLPIFIRNKKIYLKNKLLSTKNNRFNNKDINNLHKLITRNIHKNICSKNLSEGDIYIKNNKINKVNNSICINSLYNLPKIKSKNKMHKSKSVIILRNTLDSKLKSEETKEKLNKKKDNFLGIENFLKEKFYSDTESKFRNKIKTKYFRNDGAIKEKIIFLKKFGIFWRGFIQYCAPIINLKKFKMDFNKKYENSKDNNIINGALNNDYNNKSKKIFKYRALSLPKIDSSKK